MIGIVLAGGLATRLPNKALLPLHNGKPAITSGIDFLIKNQVTEIKIVVPSRSSIHHVLRFYYNNGFDYVVQRDPLGVPQAISEVNAKEDALIVYCDNVYDDVDFIYPLVSSHSIQQIDDIEKSRHLAKYDNNKFRWESECISNLCVAGWMYLKYSDLVLANHFKSTINFLNEIHAEATLISTKNWWDIGTVETYRNYWESFR